LKVLAKESISFMCFINCTYRSSRMMQGRPIYFMLAESMPYKYKKALVLILTTVFGCIHFAVRFVAHTVCAGEQTML